MSNDKHLPRISPWMGGMVALLLIAFRLGAAPNFWTGPTIDFPQSADTASDAVLPGVVELTRGGNDGLYNIAAMVATNLATSSTVAFSEAFITNTDAFYRVGRQINP